MGNYESISCEDFDDFEICSFCLNEALPAFLECPGCKTRIYCSKTCQEQDWTLVHHRYCRQLLRIVSTDLMWCGEDNREPLRQSLISHILMAQDCQMERVLRLRRSQQEQQEARTITDENRQEAHQDNDESNSIIGEDGQEALQDEEEANSINNSPVCVEEISDCFF